MRQLDAKEIKEINEFAHDMCLQGIKLSCKACVKGDYGKGCMYLRLATRLYKNRNYRKIHDDEIILKKNRYVYLLRMEQLDEEEQ